MKLDENKLPEILLSDLVSYSECKCKSITLDTPNGSFTQKRHLIYNSIKISILDVRKELPKRGKTDSCGICLAPEKKINFIFDIK